MPRPLPPRLAAIGGSVFSRLAAQIGAAPRPPAPLHVGDTHRPPPPGCHVEALAAADHPGLHRYLAPKGHPGLIDDLAAHLRARWGSPVDPACLLITPGATGALSAIAAATLEPGDEVLVLAPYWPLIVGIIRMVGAVPVELPLLAPGPPPDAGALKAALAAAVGPRTVAVYLNSPHNPTGAVLDAAQIDAVVDVCRAHDLYLWSDEVYADLSFVGPPPAVAPRAPERTFAVGSFSKGWGMAGYRCGWVLLPPDAALRGALWKMVTHQSYGAAHPAQLAARAALAGGALWQAEARAEAAAVGAAAAARLGVPAPAGGSFLFLDLRGCGPAGLAEDDATHEMLVRCLDAGVLLAPGRSCGQAYAGFARLCFTAAPPDAVLRAVDAVAGVLGR
ncbi:MAG: hypothetical protein RL071_3727 [Pseudomonadota bacterium]